MNGLPDHRLSRKSHHISPVFQLSRSPHLLNDPQHSVHQHKHPPSPKSLLTKQKQQRSRHQLQSFKSPAAFSRLEKYRVPNMNAYPSNYYGEAPLQATEGAPDNRQNASSGANGARDDVVSMDMKQKGRRRDPRHAQRRGQSSRCSRRGQLQEFHRFEASADGGGNSRERGDST